MVTQIVWWAGNICLFTLVARALAGRFFSKYPVFFAYLSCVLLSSLSRFLVYQYYSAKYKMFYWYTDIVLLFIGFGVTWEVYVQVFEAYPGVRRFARALLSTALAGLIYSGLLNLSNGSVWGSVATMMELERNFRATQAIFLTTILGLLAYYGIPIGRNLRGIILGYGLFVSASVINMTLGTQFGGKFTISLEYLQRLSYLLSLVIWCASLWVYKPTPAFPNARIAIDYDLLCLRTTKALNRIRAYLLDTVRS